MVTIECFRSSNFCTVSRLGRYFLPLPLPGTGILMNVVSTVKVLSAVNSWFELSLVARLCKKVSNLSLPCANSCTEKMEGLEGVSQCVILHYKMDPGVRCCTCLLVYLSLYGST